jgi:hypothetical protein
LEIRTKVVKKCTCGRVIDIDTHGIGQE